MSQEFSKSNVKQYNLTVNLVVPSFADAKKSFHSKVEWMSRKVELLTNILAKKNVQRALWAGAAIVSAVACAFFGVKAYSAFISLIELSGRYATHQKVIPLVHKMVLSGAATVISGFITTFCIDNAIGKKK